MAPFLPHHPLAPRRMAALILIAAVALGLGYLRFAPDSDRPTVPAGARSGDLNLKPCTYSTDGGDYAADCGTLIVPENRADPNSRLIALPVTRIRAAAANPGTPIFRLEGGPGKTNMDFPQAGRFVGEHDVVLVGYRGVDGSVRLDCPEVATAIKHAGDVLNPAAQERYGAAFTACAARLQREGVDLGGYSIPQRADDIEAARTALGYGRINLISESAGTRYALVYGWRYPESVARSVLIAANPPGHFLYDARDTDMLLKRYAALCNESASCRARTGDLAETMRRTAADLPERWFFLPVHPGNVRAGSFFGLMESGSAAAPLAAPITLDSWLAAADGDASGLWFYSLLAGAALSEGRVWGETAAMGTQDAAAARAFYADGAGRAGILGAPGTDFLWGSGALADAWPHHPDQDLYARMQPSAVETLVISGALDFATPPRVAEQELLPYLSNGHQVQLAGLGHTVDFWSHQRAAADHLVLTFFRDGTVDPSHYTPNTIDFTPGLTHTMLAKIVLGTMLATAGLALLSLLAMAARLHRRRAFGTTASAGLRSLLPVVLGLGGWFAGVLVALTFWPTVPFDDERLAVLATGLPVGAGIALAWLNLGDGRMRRAGGAALAMGGALIGAWLGFHAESGTLAVLTAIAAATAGANLALIGLDSVPASAEWKKPMGTAGGQTSPHREAVHLG